MASLNLSVNGPSIQKSYQGVVNAPAPPADSSSTYGQWALFSVQAPLASAFQDSGSKESVLKVQTTGEGELEELIEDFSEGRVQFAFLKVKDPNTGLPKSALIAWCGGGVPERTKGYFTSHLNAVSKILHGYHVQITARSDSDLEPASILQKISDASGAKYTAGGSAPLKAGGPPPPVKSKPVFAAASSSGYNPLVAARDARLRATNDDGDDGWGDAPQVSRSEIQKVESAYKPTKVNMDELRNQKQGPSRATPSSREDDAPRDVVGGGYQPVGKVDIGAIRAAAKNKQDDRPTPVKGAYEPVGKVDISAIKAQAKKPAAAEPTPEPEADEPPKSLAERSAAFNQSERLTELPKPKVAKKFGGAAAYTGTKAPTPGGGLGLTGPAPSSAAPPPVGLASRTFADQGGKTPAQLWAEKKAAQGGAPSQPTPASPVQAQTSGGGGWKSGYAGKSWAPVQTGSYGRGIPGQKTGETVTSEDAPTSPAGGVGGLKDRFQPSAEEEQGAPPPPPMGSRPAPETPSGGFALPGMPPRPPPPTDEPEEEPEPEREQSPPRVAVPVARGAEPEIEPPQLPPQTLPVRQLEEEVPKEEDVPVEEEAHDPRAAATAVAAQQFSQEQVEQPAAAATGGKRARIIYDYEKAEDNEIELVDGDIVTNIDMVDDDWWMGTNSRGESGLFPSNYVELIDDDEGGAPLAPPSPAPAGQAAVPPPPPPAAEPEPQPTAAGGHSATAEFDYEAAEDNELSFPENAVITNIEFPDEDWWFGHYKGDSGLFPANYVKLN